MTAWWIYWFITCHVMVAMECALLIGQLSRETTPYTLDFENGGTWNPLPPAFNGMWKAFTCRFFVLRKESRYVL